MSKLPSRTSAARRNAEAMLNQTKKRESSFKLDQEREHEAMVLKTTRLRELRLAKEAAEEKPPRQLLLRVRKTRRSKQTT